MTADRERISELEEEVRQLRKMLFDGIRPTKARRLSPSQYVVLETIASMNDEVRWRESPEARFSRMRGWVASQIKEKVEGLL